jgi:hypothetical protein
VSEVKAYRLVGRVVAFRFWSNADLPSGWVASTDKDRLISPDGFYVYVEPGDWVVGESDWWSRMSNEDFQNKYEECES